MQTFHLTEIVAQQLLWHIKMLLKSRMDSEEFQKDYTE